MDEFTRQHLRCYVDDFVWPDEQDDFETWALAQVENDPTLADMGWPTLYRTWEHEVARGTAE